MIQIKQKVLLWIIFGLVLVPYGVSADTLDINCNYNITTKQSDFPYYTNFHLNPTDTTYGSGLKITTNTTEIPYANNPINLYPTMGLTSGAGFVRAYSSTTNDFYGTIMTFDYTGTGQCLNPTTTFPSTITNFDISTSTQTINIKGYWTATTTNNIYQQIEFYQFDNLLGQQSFNYVTATTTGNFNFTFSYRGIATQTATSTATFYPDTIFYANIFEYNNNYFNDPFSGIIDPRYKVLLVATTTTLQSTTTIQINNLVDLFAYPEYECSITSITGCFKNALIWAFYPTQDSLDNLKSFKDTIETKAPFGYFIQAKNSLGSISATSTKIFNITLPKSLKDYMFSPLDIGLSGIIWFFFLTSFYKRLKYITI